MDKLLLWICIFILTIGKTAFAQDSDNNGFYVGPSIAYFTGSIDLSQNRAVRGVDLPNFNSIGGGLILSYQFDKIFLQTELIYSLRESVDPSFESLNTSPFKSSLTASFSYINIPLLVGYRFSNRSLTPYGILGIQIGVSTKDELSQVFEPDTPNFIPQNQPFTKWDKTEFGIVAEVGVKKYLTSKSLISLGFRYTGAERSYLINPGQISGGSANLGNKLISGSISYLFSF